MYIDIYLALFI